MFVVFTVDEMLELGKIGQSIVFHPGKIFISTWNLSKYNNQFLKMFDISNDQSFFYYKNPWKWS